MPLYVYRCEVCRWRCEEYRTIKTRNRKRKCNACGAECRRVLTAAAIPLWKADRAFPNLNPHGDGTMTFKSKAAYEQHLRKKNIAEVGIDAPKKRRSGTKVVMTDGRTA